MCLSRKKILEKFSEEELKKLLVQNSCDSLEELCSAEIEKLNFIDFDVEDCKNRYIWFIEDEDLERVMKYTKSEYSSENTEFDEKDFFKNRIDVLKMILDTSFNKISAKEWVDREIFRQKDKTDSNIIGFLQEKIINLIDGWQALRVGNTIDIQKVDGTIIMELKNKFNTTKGEDEIGIYEKLDAKIQQHPEIKKAYYARIYDKSSTHEQWTGNRKLKTPLSGVTHKKFDNPKIEKISGDKLYEILTGDSLAFKKLIYAIPKVLKNLGFNNTFDIDGEVEKYIIEKNFALSDYLGFEDKKTCVLKEELESYLKY